MNSKSIDYNSIIDKMNVNMDNNKKLLYVNVSILLGCNFLTYFLNILTCFCKVIIKETNKVCYISHVLKVSNNNKINNIEIGNQIMVINRINT